MDLSQAEKDKLELLRQKYALSGQDMVSYLEGLLHARYLTYWDYLHVDTLLGLQQPRTDFPDETIFIVYHQITELYFKLIQLEVDQLLSPLNAPTPASWQVHLRRMVSYFRQLCTSFETMVEGMAPEQFLQFRMALLPASGFQSVQFREIELKLTTTDRLVAEAFRADAPNLPPHQNYPNIYWKQGNRNANTGEKTLTLQMFEERYDAHLLGLASQYATTNLRSLWLAHPTLHTDATLVQLLRQLDLYANVFWRLAHYKSAVKYLQKDPDVIKATGGTNWQQYLPPRFQQVIYFPEVWSAEEQSTWGREWVVLLFKEQVEQVWV